MYNSLPYDLLNYLTLFIRYGASSLLCLSYVRSFLKEKNSRKVTFWVWNIIYLLGAFTLYFAFDNVNVFQNILCIAARIVFLLILQRLLFYSGGAAAPFTVFSFIVGKNLILSVISVLVHKLLWDLFLGIIVDVTEGFSGEKLWLILFILNVFLSVLAMAAFIAGLGLYLKIIKKCFRKKDCRLQKRESVFLLLPLITSMVISVTVRAMEFNETGSVYSDIFDVVPLTMLFIPMTDIFLLGTDIAVIILFQSLVEFNEEKNKRNLLESQISQMRNEIREIQDIYSDIRGLRHDMKNHIENISLYIKRTSNMDKPLEEYIGNMKKTVDRLDFTYNTGNPICDVIINRKSTEAEKKGIGFKSDFTFPLSDNPQIDPYDIGVIISNALENAIKACEKTDEGAFIFLRSYVKGSLFFIETQNSFTGELKYDTEGIPLSSKKGSTHGYGLSNIERTAKKYMGGMDISTEERNGKRVFSLTVMLHF